MSRELARAERDERRAAGEISDVLSRMRNSSSAFGNKVQQTRRLMSEGGSSGKSSQEREAGRESDISSILEARRRNWVPSYQPFTSSRQ